MGLPTSASRLPERPPPGLKDLVLPELGLMLLVDQLEAGPLVDPARTLQCGVCPEHHVPVADLRGVADALVYEARADSHAARGRIDEEQAQLGGLVVLADTHDRADG